MSETIKTIMEWHEQTFPDETLGGQLLKFAEESKEFEEAQNLHELADMFIVACGVARFSQMDAVDCFYRIRKSLKKWRTLERYGINVFQMVLDEKMAKNRRRVWKKTSEGCYHHENGIED